MGIQLKQSINQIDMGKLQIDYAALLKDYSIYRVQAELAGEKEIYGKYMYALFVRLEKRLRYVYAVREDAGKVLFFVRKMETETFLEQLETDQEHLKMIDRYESENDIREGVRKRDLLYFLFLQQIRHPKGVITEYNRVIQDKKEQVVTLSFELQEAVTDTLKSGESDPIVYYRVKTFSNLAAYKDNLENKEDTQNGNLKTKEKENEEEEPKYWYPYQFSTEKMYLYRIYDLEQTSDDTSYISKKISNSKETVSVLNGSYADAVESDPTTKTQCLHELLSSVNSSVYVSDASLSLKQVDILRLRTKADAKTMQTKEVQRLCQESFYVYLMKENTAENVRQAKEHLQRVFTQIQSQHKGIGIRFLNNPDQAGFGDKVLVVQKTRKKEEDSYTDAFRETYRKRFAYQGIGMETILSLYSDSKKSRNTKGDKTLIQILLNCFYELIIKQDIMQGKSSTLECDGFVYELIERTNHRKEEEKEDAVRVILDCKNQIYSDRVRYHFKDHEEFILRKYQKGAFNPKTGICSRELGFGSIHVMHNPGSPVWPVASIELADIKAFRAKLLEEIVYTEPEIKEILSNVKKDLKEKKEEIDASVKKKKKDSEKKIKPIKRDDYEELLEDIADIFERLFQETDDVVRWPEIKAVKWNEKNYSKEDRERYKPYASAILRKMKNAIKNKHKKELQWAVKSEEMVDLLYPAYTQTSHAPAEQLLFIETNGNPVENFNEITNHIVGRRYRIERDENSSDCINIEDLIRLIYTPYNRYKRLSVRTILHKFGAY